MHDYNVKLTNEAIYDIAEIADYIEAAFGIERADKFQRDIQKQVSMLGYLGPTYMKTQIFYRGYSIHRKPMPPSIIFYVVIDSVVHVLRVLRHERNWEQVLKVNDRYTY